MNDAAACPVCGAAAAPLGSKTGRLIPAEYRFRHCAACGYSFVENPSADFARIYDENYYRGKGADPLLDYINELDEPQNTVRAYEWRGILRVVSALTSVTAQTQWLDFGCGNGGLVRHVREHTPCRASGFEEGWVVERARSKGIPILTRDELAVGKGTFDVITAIEVIEHIPRPLEILREIRSLLKPGGLLFLTTGNAEPYRGKLLRWAYTIPEIHVSFFEPRTLERVLGATGFRTEFRPPPAGFNDILRFKILKNLGVRKTSFAEKLLPWPLLCYAADKRYKVTAHPIGWAV